MSQYLSDYHRVFNGGNDPDFTTTFTAGFNSPIAKPRWIYSCANQLLDRVIAAYGQQEGLKYTLFRPFNWIGSGLDSLHTQREGSSRVVTQFLGHIAISEDIKLVDCGSQRRSFTDVSDGISTLVKIIENRDGIADGKFTISAIRPMIFPSRNLLR